MSTPNRMETFWKEMRPLLLKKWERLTDSDLDYIDGEFDRLVKVVRQRYDDPVITVKEAHIRQAVLDLLTQVESENPAE
ncbi:MAG: hypothetical protein U1F57_03585 [bacterium]